MKKGCDIIIIGGGFSGLMTAANAARQARRRLRILWVDEIGRFARGTAYSTKEITHLLNVPAARMGAWADAVGDFSRWLAARYPAYGTHAFAPRLIYGEYLESIAAEARSRADIHTLTATAIGARRESGGFTVTFADYTTITAPALVLATGNPPCRDLGWPVNDLYVPDFWHWRLAGGKIGNDGDSEDPVVVAGTGLTTVDAVMSLRGDGYAGPILAVSPHGQWPQPHAPAPPGAFPHFLDDLRQMPAARSYLRVFRNHLEEFPGEWRALVDALRDDTPALWQDLRESEKARFARHLLSLWNTHRHRMAPEIHEKLARDKKLNVMAGHIIAAGDNGNIAIRPRGDDGAWRFRAVKIINCTGPSFRTLAAGNPLLASLAAQELVRPGPLGMGIATPQAPGLFAIGTPLTGERLETVAVPELRAQAADAAGKILNLLKLA